MDRLLTEEVDIFSFPNEVKSLDPECQELSIEPLYANPFKLLFVLLHYGIATGITKEDYYVLVNIYKKQTEERSSTLLYKPETLNYPDLENYRNILKKLKISNKIKIRLMGNVCADRAQNDYFILKLLERLTEEQLEFDILMSAQSLLFLKWYEKLNKEQYALEHKTEKKFPFKEELKKLTNHNIAIIKPDHSSEDLHSFALDTSCQNLGVLLNRHYVDAQEILNIVRKSYINNIKLIDYTCVGDAENASIIIYSMVAIDLNIIKMLAEQFQVVYLDNSPKVLGDTINKINLAFQKKILDTGITVLLKQKKYRSKVSKGATNNPFLILTSNRRLEGLQQRERHETHTYGIKFYSGDGAQKVPNMGENFPKNHLGKSIYYHIGKITVLECSPVLMLEKEATVGFYGPFNTTTSKRSSQENIETQSLLPTKTKEKNATKKDFFCATSLLLIGILILSICFVAGIAGIAALAALAISSPIMLGILLGLLFLVGIGTVTAVVGIVAAKKVASHGIVKQMLPFKNLFEAVKMK